MLSPPLSTRSSFESLHSNTSSVLSSPDRLPPAVNGSMVWQGKELDPSEYVVRLSEGEIRDVRAAIIKFKRKICHDQSPSFPEVTDGFGM